MEKWWLVLAFVAGVCVWFRFLPFFKLTYPKVFKGKYYPLVSIIIPVRNEEATIAKLLNSLLKINYAALEIIVVDDHSTDNTSHAVAQFPVKFLKASTKPTNWVGKSWACHIGALAATGDLLLFTDADTIHTPNSLHHAVADLINNDAALLSAPPYHLNSHWWEKLLGPFHCLIYAGSSPFHQRALR